MKEKIFLIHGLFMHGTIMCYMEKQLKNCGYDVEVFSYKTIKRPLDENAQLLTDFIKQNQEPGQICHYVGHSLGGLLIRLVYEINPSLFSGRIVTLGTPHTGSHIAHRVATDIHQGILGGAYEDALDGDMPNWQGSVEFGSIAGNKGVGLGMVLGNLEKPNDGTVSVSETQLENQTDHAQVSVSHTALIFSKQVIEHVDCFLKNGQFLSQ